LCGRDRRSSRGLWGRFGRRFRWRLRHGRVKPQVLQRRERRRNHGWHGCRCRSLCRPRRRSRLWGRRGWRGGIEAGDAKGRSDRESPDGQGSCDRLCGGSFGETALHLLPL
jgi:hypothetical protein